MKYLRRSKTRTTRRPLIEGLETRTLLSVYTLNTLGVFDGDTNGAVPEAGVTFDSNGDLFGTTVSGVVFEVARGTTSITAVANFNGTNGSGPQASVTFDSSGNLFGTAASGGANDLGDVFEIAKGSTTITDVADFDGSNGQHPTGPVIFDAAGNLFGTSSGNPGMGLDGCVFEIAKGSTTITTIANFSGTDGSGPMAGLTLDTNGNLFGTTFGGGSLSDGTVFEIASGSSSITSLASFEDMDGAHPICTLVLDTNGDLFGTTNGDGELDILGTVFEIPHGTTSINTIAKFNSGNGQNPDAGLTMDGKGDLFGTTEAGGANGNGTVFEIAQGSTSITTLVSFSNVTDGAFPLGDVMLDSAGDLFGTTSNGGGMNNDGIVFELSPMPGPVAALAFATQPGTTVAGATIAPPVTVRVEDANGILETSDSSPVTLAIASGPAGATLSGNVTINAVNGIATFPNLSLKTAGAYTLTATDPGLMPATTASFNITPGAAAKLAFMAVPPGADLDAAIIPAVTVSVEDSNGNVVPTDSSAVTVSIASGPGGATLGGTLTVNAVSGVATFPDLSLNQLGAYTLMATDGMLAPVTSGNLAVTLGVAADVAFTALPLTAVAGTVITPAVTASVEDSNGNVIPTDTSAITLSIASGPGGGVLGGALTASAVNGVATFSNLTFSLPGNYTLQASDGTLNADTSMAITVFAPAKIGGLDPSFGFGGIAAHNVGLTSTAGVVVEGDGKSIIAGTGGSAGAGTFGLTRYNTDGSLDTTFGVNGVTQTPFAGDAMAAGEALLPNGDVLIAGTDTTIVHGVATGSEFALVEYTATGQLDTTFGNGAGFVLTSFSSTAGTLSNDVAHALAVGADGTIYLGGSSDAGGHELDFAVAAYAPSGSPSPAFGANGKVLLDFAGGDDSVAALKFASGGKLIAAGSAVDPASGVSSVALAEFLPTGALNAKFGSKGKLTMNVGGVADAASALALDPRGNIIVGGYTATGSAAAGTLSANFLLLRFTSLGKLDKTFGRRGIVSTSFNQPAAISSVLINADGSIVATGKTVSSLTGLDPSHLNLAVARYTAKGQLDTTFNGTGQAIIGLDAVVAPQSLTPAGGPIEQAASLQFAAIIPFDTASDLMSAFMQLTQSAQGTVATTSGGELLAVGNSGDNTIEAAIVASGLDLAATLMTVPPPSVVGGAKGTATVNIAEAGTTLASGTFTVELFASTSPFLATGQAPFKTFPEKLRLKVGAARKLRLAFTYPSSLSSGNYFLVAAITTGATRDLNPANNTSPSTSPVLIAPPFVQLAGSALTAPTFSGTKPATVSFTLTNLGNVTASGKSAVQFFASTTGSLIGATPLATVPLPLLLKPHAPHLFKVKLALPAALPAATYTLVALLDPANIFHDPNAAMNFIVSGNMFVVG